LEPKDYFVSKSARDDLLEKVNEILKLKTKVNLVENK
jgi:hypothetical protein